MNVSFLGIGPLELLFLLILVLVIFRPEDLIATGRKVGKFLNRVKKSDLWNSVQAARKKANEVGQSLVEESGIQDVRQEMNVMPDLDQFRRELDQFGFKPNHHQLSKESPSPEIVVRNEQ